MKALGLCAACLVWIASAPVAAAAKLSDAVPGRPGLTYFTLLKRVITDLQPDGTGHKVVTFQHIEGKAARADPPDTITLTSVDVRTVPHDPSRILVLADLGPSDGNAAGAVMLALFELGPRPKLLDAVEVGYDQNTGFLTDKAPAMLAADAPLILISSSHENSSRNYLSTEMIFVHDGRFRLIDSVSTVGETSCSYHRDRDPTFATLPGPGPYRAVSVTVRQRITLTHAENCDETAPKPGVSTYRAVYRWDAKAQRFATTSTKLKRLSADDAE